MDFSCFFFSVLNESAVLILHSADREILKAPEPPKPKKNRCFMCRKKVGLTGNREPLKLMWLLLNITDKVFTSCYFDDLGFILQLDQNLNRFQQHINTHNESRHQKHLFWSSDIPNVLRNLLACYQDDDVLSFASVWTSQINTLLIRYDPASSKLCDL